jgi:hypothetical protein
MRRFLTAALVAAAVVLAVALGGGAMRRGVAGGFTRAFARLLLAPATPSPGGVVALGHADRGLPLPLILGYYDGGGVAELRSYVGELNGIVPFWYTIHADGSVTGAADPSVLRFASRHHLWVFALVQNMSGPVVYHRLFTDPLARARALENLLALCEAYGYDGVNLDFEAIAPEDRARYTAFVADLTRLFHANGYYVTLSLPAETADQPGNPWTGAYDYRALGRLADLVMVMAYDEHSSDSAPSGGRSGARSSGATAAPARPAICSTGRTASSTRCTTRTCRASRRRCGLRSATICGGSSSGGSASRIRASGPTSARSRRPSRRPPRRRPAAVGGPRGAAPTG